MFIVALFVMAQTENNPNIPQQVNDWTNDGTYMPWNATK